jgi:hypothetical protein
MASEDFEDGEPQSSEESGRGGPQADVYVDRNEIQEALAELEEGDEVVVFSEYGQTVNDTVYQVSDNEVAIGDYEPPRHRTLKIREVRVCELTNNPTHPLSSGERIEKLEVYENGE